MKEKILALLMAQFSGVRKDGLAHIANILALQVDTEDEAKTIVGKLTADQIDSFISDWRKDADAEINKANKTYEEGLKKKYDFSEKKTEPGKPIQDAGKEIDAAAIQKLITESIASATKPLLEQINSFKAGETAKTRLQSLNDKLNECEDENFKAKALKDFARMKFETDDEFKEYLTDTEGDIKTANQNVADSGLGSQSRPSVSNTTTGIKEATDAEIKAIMDLLPI